MQRFPSQPTSEGVLGANVQRSDANADSEETIEGIVRRQAKTLQEEKDDAADADYFRKLRTYPDRSTRKVYRPGQYWRECGVPVAMLRGKGLKAKK